MAAKKQAERISKRTGKPVRQYTKPTEKPTKRGRRKAATSAAEVTRPRRVRVVIKNKGRRARSLELPPEQQAERAALRAAYEAEETALIVARTKAIFASVDLANLYETGPAMRARYEAAGLMVPGVVGIVIADPKQVSVALDKIAKDAAKAEAERVALAKVEAEKHAASVAEQARVAAEKAAAEAKPETAPTEPPPPATPRTVGDEATA